MIEIYAKKQRAKRKDPQQEAIVAEKDLINERTKKLIALMISMKKGWNGGPSPDIGVEKFNLTQPIPDVVVGTGDTALHELSDIVQTLRQIKNMQDTYAVSHGERSEALKKLREQKEKIQPEVQPQQPPTPPANDAQQQIVAAVSEELMKKTASNPLTRIWTHIVAYNPFASEKNRGYRLELLRSLARIDDSLEDIEDKVLSQSESSVLDSVYVAKQLYSDAKSSFFGDFRKNINKMLSDAENELESLKDAEEERKNRKPTVVRDSTPPATGTDINVDLSAAIGRAQETLAETQEAVQEAASTRREDATIPATGRDLSVNLESAIQEGEREGAAELLAPPTPAEAGWLERELENEEQERRKAERASRTGVEREERAKARETARKAKEKKKLLRSRKNVPVAPVPQSDFVDSDFEKVQREKYEKITEYVFQHVGTLLRECLAIANGNLPRFWKIKVREETQKIRGLGLEIVQEMKVHADFDITYTHFLEGAGIIKALAYVAEAEVQAAASDPEFVSGSLFNEAEIKSQAINFAREQMRVFSEMSQKISQASVASRFIKRMITHIIPRRDKNLRLTISRNIRQARRGLQKLLDILEQRNVDFRKLMDASKSFLESMSHIFEELADLGDMYNATMRMEKSVRKQRSVKMTYDMIPTMDINALRIAGKSMNIDLFNVYKLEQLESDLTDPQGTDE
jgi:hypothetical protein